MDLFELADYKKIVTHLINNRSSARGEFSRIARYLGVSNVHISQVFKGHKELSLEQGLKLTKYFELNELETKYFVTCLNLNRAGDQALRSYYENELAQIRNRSKEISSRVYSDKRLSDVERSIYYSDWLYSAVHLCVAVSAINTDQEIEAIFNLEPEKIKGITSFLLGCGLIKRNHGQYQIGNAYLHEAKDSPYLKMHHRNWRMLSSLRAGDIKDNELMYTAPMVISKKLGKEIRQNLLQFIQELVKSTEGCEDEEVWNLNIDFLKLT